jgi:hypothetical protein
MPSTELLSRVNVTSSRRSLIVEPQLIGHQLWYSKQYDVHQAPTFTYSTPLKHNLRANQKHTPAVPYNNAITRSSSNHGGCFLQPIQTLPHFTIISSTNFHIVILPSCNHSGWFSGGWSPCQGIIFLFSTTLLFNYFIWDLPVTSSDYTSQPAHL